MWAILLITSFSYCNFLVIKSIISYLEYEVVTKIRLVEEKPTSFPSIQICNLNPFVTDEAYKFVMEYFNTKYQTKFKDIYQVIRNVSDLYLDFEKLLQQIADPKFPESQKKSFGSLLNETILYCEFNRDSCDLDEFEWFYSLEFGNCYKFNSGFNSKGEQIPLKYSYSSGINSGLILEIFHDPKKSLFSNNLKSGIQIFINNHLYTSSVSEGLQIPFGFNTKIKLKKEIIINEPKPYSSCENLDKVKNPEFINYFKSINYTYRQKDCFLLCIQKVIIEKCACHDISLPDNLGSEEPCYFNSSKYDCILDIYENYDDILEMCGLYCPLECKTVNYETKVSYVEYPSYGHYRVMLRDFKNGSKIDYQNDKESVLLLNIYFDSLKYTLINEKPKILIEDLVASIGGTMSLFLGISVLSFGELIEIFVQVIRVLVLKNPDDAF